MTSDAAEQDRSAGPLAAVPPEYAAPAVSELLDSVVSATQRRRTPTDSRLDAFLHEKSTARALAAWFGPDLPANPGELARRLNRDVAAIDALVSQQVCAVLHHEQFQRLEA